ncbi:hypothetical protein [Bacillus subtilis]|uniref:hypothetical protein n=1 Tax=Bacillus subtilis TaxID=1423 RepID=UPI000377C657|nr:hypothetical protein [Bacillus subtilis]QUG80553.1 hypothetical protein GSN02_14255 [Bacillus subtilis]
MIVTGTVKHLKESLDFEIELDEQDISIDTMPISQSSSLIINAVNRKYETNFPHSSRLNPVRIKQQN